MVDPLIPVSISLATMLIGVVVKYFFDQGLKCSLKSECCSGITFNRTSGDNNNNTNNNPIRTRSFSDGHGSKRGSRVERKHSTVELETLAFDTSKVQFEPVSKTLPLASPRVDLSDLSVFN
jgi:hypothetical protein